jgi:hypothetical protein
MVDTTAALPSLESLLGSNSAPALSFKDAKVGDSFTGIVTHAEVAQVRDYETGQPKTWDDGNPQMQVVITLATDYRDAANPEDDGERKAYLPGQKLAALKAALKEIGRSTVEKGDVFTITFIGTKPASNKKYNDVKLYGIEIKAGKTNPDVDKLLAKTAPAASGTLSAEQIDKIKKLKASQFDNSEIAAMVKVSEEEVSAVVDLF